MDINKVLHILFNCTYFLLHILPLKSQWGLFSKSYAFMFGDVAENYSFTQHLACYCDLE